MSGPELRGIGMTSQRTRDRMVARLRERGITDGRVLAAMAKVPRHLFVDEALASRAYEDSALPIDAGQTLSRPYTVARMTELVLAGGPRKVLEVGTGSGYQAALLAELGLAVYTVERVRVLYRKAAERFRRLGYGHIRSRHADGGVGWPLHAPFDAILLTAAARALPAGLLQQLADGGRIVLPWQGEDGAQQLVVIQHREEGFVSEHIEPVSFVPFLEGVVR